MSRMPCSTTSVADVDAQASTTIFILKKLGSTYGTGWRWHPRCKDTALQDISHSEINLQSSRKPRAGGSCTAARHEP